MNEIIRIATRRDAAQITALNKRYFHEAGRDWIALIAGRSSDMIVLQLGKRIIGFTGLQISSWNNSARVIDIFVHPKYRKRGYGAQLLAFILKRAKKYHVRTVMAEAPSLNPVLNLYLKCKFRICGYNDRYYSNSNKEMAIFLSFDLTNK
ncbi:MAG: GNAT family N-acetyltransferase [Patescibacteria group bacterium]|jgi:GNAT superfamily N-acetyltransferase